MSKGIFIPDITVEMMRNASLEAVETLLVEGEMHDVDMPKWIPCSDRLPNYRELVDVTTRDLRVKLAYLDSIEEDGTDDLWIMPLEDAECALWNITAWMPRPKPWEGESDD